MRSRRTFGSCAWLVVATLIFTACSLDEFKQNFISKDGTPSDIQDRQQGLTRQDYRDMNKREKLMTENGITPTAQLGAPPIPDLAQVLAAPRPPKVANSKLVTISVTEDVPLRDVLFELGRLANVDIEVGSGLDRQGINLRATDRPFNEVIERIADLGELRYSVNGNSIRVERDTPYIKNYTLDFINIVRSSSSSYNLTTSILSNNGGSSSSSSGSSDSGSSSGGVGTSGSSSTITSQAESDLWTSLQSSLTEILNYRPDVGTSATTAATAPEPAAPAGTAAGGGEAGAEGAAETPAAVAAAAAAPAPSSAPAIQASSFVVNRQAGILSVNASQRQHEMVDRFLAIMSRSVSAQVLIEAKIVEVSLRDQFLSGIDWGGVIGNLGGVGVDVGTWAPAGTTDFTIGGNGAVTLGFGLGDLDAIINLTERFGTTRTLSSPRLSAINNQQAVLTFAENRVFFNCSLPTGSTSSTIEGSTTVTGASVECSTNSVPIGIILSILPSINLDSQEITLSVRPTLTRQVNEVSNPGVAIAAAAYNLNLTGTVPVIEVREIDSVMKVKSGGVMVIGGLMEDTTATQNRGIAGASELPIVGNLFKSRDEDSRKRELIILIKATIVNSTGSAHPVDRAVIKRFSTDPRPAFEGQ